jgi:cation transporter-like permease
MLLPLSSVNPYRLALSSELLPENSSHLVVNNKSFINRLLIMIVLGIFFHWSVKVIQFSLTHFYFNITETDIDTFLLTLN